MYNRANEAKKMLVKMIKEMKKDEIDKPLYVVSHSQFMTAFTA